MIQKRIFFALNSVIWTLIIGLSLTSPAHANFGDIANAIGGFFSGPSGGASGGIAPTLNSVFYNTFLSLQFAPHLILSLSYLFAILLAASGVVKVKEHVENPNQTALRVPVARFFIGGALLSLPIVYEVMGTVMDPDRDDTFNPYEFTFSNFIGGALAMVSGGAANLANGILGSLGLGTIGGPAADLINSLTTLPTINGTLATIASGIAYFPQFVVFIAYLMGTIAGVSGVYKLKDYIENPDQTSFKEPVARFLFGGALFSMPTVYSVMRSFMAPNPGVLGQFDNILSGAGFFFSNYSDRACIPGTDSLGNVLCMFIVNSASLPTFLNLISYVFGVVLGVWGVAKIRDHVLDPTRTSIWEGVSRLFAGGAFFGLPVAVYTIKATLMPASSGLIALVGGIGQGFFYSGYNEQALDCNADNGLQALDGMLYCTMNDILTPIHSSINFFAFVAGSIFVMIGISRLMKSAQDGARAPGGLGTLLTFFTGGMLLSFNELIRNMTASMFTNPLTVTFATLQYCDGMSPAEINHAHTVISAVLKLMIIVGLISFVRGIFILRAVGEGNGSASLMASFTHMIAGSIAVNMGPFLNVMENTLGITGLGISFSTAGAVGQCGSGASGNAGGGLSGAVNGAVGAVGGAVNGAVGAVGGAVNGAVGAVGGAVNGAAGGLPGLSP